MFLFGEALGMTRSNNRPDHALREWRFDTGYLPYAQGSVMTHSGRTQVLCAATLEERQPGWMSDPKTGWVKAEYNMLPASTHQRSRRRGRSPSKLRSATRSAVFWLAAQPQPASWCLAIAASR